MNPLFIFSLPRSGSTLIQRILMSHKDIASVAEPWFLLPFVYAFKKEGVLTEYRHNISYAALEDFIKNLPNQEDDYFKALRVFANTLYEKQCSRHEIYFLDKTPRYYFIIPEIARIFPDAKFIFLFRNPVHVMSSMLQTWSKSTLKKMYAYDRDLKYGLKSLSEGYNLLKENSYAIKYECFVTEPKKYTWEICNYLNIDFDENMLSSFSNQDIKGRKGDPTGAKEYQSIETKSLEKWKKIFNTKFRKKIVFDYVNSIDDSVLVTQGYDKQNILDEIRKLEVVRRDYFKDRLHIQYSLLVRKMKLNIWFAQNTRKWASDRYLS